MMVVIMVGGGGGGVLGEGGGVAGHRSWDWRHEPAVTVLRPGAETVARMTGLDTSGHVTRVGGAGSESWTVTGVVTRVRVGSPLWWGHGTGVSWHGRHGRVWSEWRVVVRIVLVHVRVGRISLILVTCHHLTWGWCQRLGCWWKTGAGLGHGLLLDDGPHSSPDTHWLVVTDQVVKVLNVVHCWGQDLHSRDLLLVGGCWNCCSQLLKTNINLFDSVALPRISPHCLGHLRHAVVLCRWQGIVCIFLIKCYLPLCHHSWLWQV